MVGILFLWVIFLGACWAGALHSRRAARFRPAARRERRVCLSVLLGLMGYGAGVGTVANASVALFGSYRVGLGPNSPFGPLQELLCFGTPLVGLAVPWLAAPRSSA